MIVNDVEDNADYYLLFETRYVLVMILSINFLVSADSFFYHSDLIVCYTATIRFEVRVIQYQ